MSSQIRVLTEVDDFFTRESVPYVIIGGIALQWWGEPRFTRDVDVMIMVKIGKEIEVLKKIFRSFPPRISNALSFALKHRVCLVKSRKGIEIDISFGVPGYEEECLKRSIRYKINKISAVRICSAEDLIIHKALAGRQQDLADIESIIIRRGKKLNTKYIRKWLKEFSGLLEMKEIIDRFEKAWKSRKGKY
ncbi:MAG: nucleotidyltransferase [Ignavibacteriales bacterium]|nr:nucleotidyltransferase [Ignavibacteriales bacterium]